MINKQNDFQIKERHDIFDIVLLKQKEKRILYLLMLTLVIVLGYEYSDQALKKIFPEYEAAIPVKAKMYILNSEKLELFASEISEFSSDLPQFHASFAVIISDINYVKVKIKESAKRKEILELQHKMVLKLWAMLNSPYLEESKELTTMKESVTNLMKKMKLSTKYVLEISPILFDKSISKPLTKPSRSIFEYSDATKSNKENASESYWDDVDNENNKNAGER